MKKKIFRIVFFLAFFSLVFYTIPVICEARNTAEKFLPGRISIQMDTDRKTYREEEPLTATFSVQNAGYYPIRLQGITWKMTNGLVITERSEEDVDGIVIEPGSHWEYQLSVYGTPETFGYRIPSWYVILIIAADILLVMVALAAIVLVKKRERSGVVTRMVCIVLILSFFLCLPERAQASDAAIRSSHRWARKKTEMLLNQLPGMEHLQHTEISCHIGYLIVSVPYAGKTVKVRAELSYEILE